MKNKINSYVQSIVIGMGFGMPTMIICMIIIGGYNQMFKEFIVWMIASALFGVVSRLIFGNENLNLPVATVMHCVSCFVITIIAGSICGYADGVFPLIVGIAPIFVIAYAIIYIISMITMRIEVKDVNKALDERE